MKFSGQRCSVYGVLASQAIYLHHNTKLLSVIFITPIKPINHAPPHHQTKPSAAEENGRKISGGTLFGVDRKSQLGDGDVLNR